MVKTFAGLGDSCFAARAFLAASARLSVLDALWLEDEDVDELAEAEEEEFCAA